MLGYLFAIPLRRLLGIDEIWGAAGLTASAGIAGWVEMLLLRATLNARIGASGLASGYVARLWTAAMVGAALGWATKLMFPIVQPIAAAAVILGIYGLAFGGMTVLLRIPEASTALARLTRR